MMSSNDLPDRFTFDAFDVPDDHFSWMDEEGPAGDDPRPLQLAQEPFHRLAREAQLRRQVEMLTAESRERLAVIHHHHRAIANLKATMAAAGIGDVDSLPPLGVVAVARAHMLDHQELRDAAVALRDALRAGGIDGGDCTPLEAVRLAAKIFGAVDEELRDA